MARLTNSDLHNEIKLVKKDMAFLKEGQTKIQADITRDGDVVGSFYLDHTDNAKTRVVLNGEEKKYESADYKNSFWENNGSSWEFVDGRLRNYYKGDTSWMRIKNGPTVEGDYVYVEGKLRSGWTKLKFNLRTGVADGNHTEGYYNNDYKMYRKLK